MDRRSFIALTAVTADRGTLEQAATVPDSAKPGETMVFTVETEDGRVRLISPGQGIGDHGVRGVKSRRSRR